MRWWWAPPAALLGVAVGLAGLVVHRHALWVEAWPLPWGLFLAVAAPTAVGLRLRGRMPALVGFLSGWLMLDLAALTDGPGGDFVLLSDALGWGFLVLSMMLMVVLAVGAIRRRQEGRTGA